MTLRLSWDLFILVFFAVVIAYSFIIGRNQTLKVILGTYVAILCADGLGNLFGKYFASSESFLRFLRFFSSGNEVQAITFLKVIVLIALVVLISVRGLFQVDAEDDRTFSLRLSILLLLGVLSAGLMISGVLVFVSGASFIGGPLYESNLLADVYRNSRFVQIMIDYANLWFFLPGAVFVAMGLLHKKSA
jgi:hypothetical protein